MARPASQTWDVASESRRHRSGGWAHDRRECDIRQAVGGGSQLLQREPAILRNARGDERRASRARPGEPQAPSLRHANRPRLCWLCVTRLAKPCGDVVEVRLDVAPNQASGFMQLRRCGGVVGMLEPASDALCVG